MVLRRPVGVSRHRVMASLAGRALTCAFARRSRLHVWPTHEALMINHVSVRLNRRATFHWLPSSALAVIALAGVGLVTSTSASRADGLKDIQARGYMTAATEDDFRPFEFVEDGVSKGYDNDVLTEVKKSLPFQVRQEIMPWAGILPGVT